MKTIIIIMQFVVALAAFANGLLCYKNPSRAIAFQKKFYERINWRLEPIDMKKELRNTRIMGLLSIFLSILITVVIITKF